MATSPGEIDPELKKISGTLSSTNTANNDEGNRIKGKNEKTKTKAKAKAKVKKIAKRGSSVKFRKQGNIKSSQLEGSSRSLGRHSSSTKTGNSFKIKIKKKMKENKKGGKKKNGSVENIGKSKRLGKNYAVNALGKIKNVKLMSVDETIKKKKKKKLKKKKGSTETYESQKDQVSAELLNDDERREIGTDENVHSTLTESTQNIEHNIERETRFNDVQKDSINEYTTAKEQNAHMVRNHSLEENILKQKDVKSTAHKFYKDGKTIVPLRSFIKYQRESNKMNKSTYDKDYSKEMEKETFTLGKYATVKRPMPLLRKGTSKTSRGSTKLFKSKSQPFISLKRTFEKQKSLSHLKKEKGNPGVKRREEKPKGTVLKNSKEKSKRVLKKESKLGSVSKGKEAGKGKEKGKKKEKEKEKEKTQKQNTQKKPNAAEITTLDTQRQRPSILAPTRKQFFLKEEMELPEQLPRDEIVVQEGRRGSKTARPKLYVYDPLKKDKDFERIVKRVKSMKTVEINLGRKIREETDVETEKSDNYMIEEEKNKENEKMERRSENEEGEKRKDATLDEEKKDSQQDLMISDSESEESLEVDTKYETHHCEEDPIKRKADEILRKYVNSKEKEKGIVKDTECKPINEFLDIDEDTFKIDTINFFSNIKVTSYSDDILFFFDNYEMKKKKCENFLLLFSKLLKNEYSELDGIEALLLIFERILNKMKENIKMYTLGRIFSVDASYMIKDNKGLEKDEIGKEHIYLKKEINTLGGKSVGVSGNGEGNEFNSIRSITEIKYKRLKGHTVPQTLCNYHREHADIIPIVMRDHWHSQDKLTIINNKLNELKKKKNVQVLQKATIHTHKPTCCIFCIFSNCLKNVKNDREEPKYSIYSPALKNVRPQYTYENCNTNNGVGCNKQPQSYKMSDAVNVLASI